jgi:hypothetical protein
MKPYTETEQKVIIAIGELLEATNHPSVNPPIVAKRTELTEEAVMDAVAVLDKDGITASVQTVLDYHVWLTPEGWSYWNWLIK